SSPSLLPPPPSSTLLFPLSLPSLPPRPPPGARTPAPFVPGGRYSDKWYSELQAKIVKAGLKAKPSQLVVSNKDGWPVLWSPDDDDSSIPDEDQWPLTFTDVTRKWSAAIWRGEAADKYRLVKATARPICLV
ncbi:unnamed protein product, partial [Prorocentrum cordatum]